MGLGNPGPEYVRTPHSVGFAGVEDVASRAGGRGRERGRFGAQVAEATVGGQAGKLVKPLTFMNASGRAVAAVLHYWQIPPADLFVIVDDADLPQGTLRLRRQGGTGGHKGLGSIVEQLGSDAFARLRIGIGRGTGTGDLVAHVLGAFSPEEWEAMRGAIGRAADAVAVTLAEGLDAAMNRFNTRSAATEPAAGAPEAGGEH